jgi:hypothetical protein
MAFTVFDNLIELAGKIPNGPGADIGTHILSGL